MRALMTAASKHGPTIAEQIAAALRDRGVQTTAAPAGLAPS